MSSYYFAQNTDRSYLICADDREQALEIAQHGLCLDLFDEETGEGFSVVKTERADLTAAEIRGAVGDRLFAPTKITHYKAQRAKYSMHAQIRSTRGSHEVEAVSVGARQIKTFNTMRAAKAWLRAWFGGNLVQVDC